MALSTSSSKKPAKVNSYFRPIVWTLCLVVLMLAGLEGATRVAFQRISRVEARIHSDYLAARATRQGGPSHPTILLLGNSLLLLGMDYDLIRKLMEPKSRPVRFVIESTSYLDWYYGIKSLLSSGARPDRIVLCLNLPQFMTDRIRGEYSAYYLIQSRDLIEAGKAAGFGATEISGLFVGRYSSFYANRNNLRNFMLYAADAPYATVLHDLTVVRGAEFSDADILAAAPRLEKLRALCAAYGVAFEFLLPPGHGQGENGLLEAGRRTGTRVLIPVAQNAWGADRYTDGLHLNHDGAVEFTKLLAPALLQSQ